MKSSDLIIVGGGASGLAAVISALRTNSGCRVTVLEHLPRAAKKILATGNGRCNLGNLNASPEKYNSAEFVSRILKRFSAGNLTAFFESLGLYTYSDSEGRLYPMSNSASSVSDALRFECSRLGAQTVCDCHVNSIRHEKGRFIVNGEYSASSLILACGGKAAPSQGSDGSGYELAKSLGHSVTRLQPALVQIVTETGRISSLKGVRVKACLKLSGGGESKGEILFTDYGISGIAAMDLSRFYTGGEQKITIDICPPYTEAELAEMISRAVLLRSGVPVDSLLTGLMPKAVGAAVIKTALGRLPERAEYIGEDRAKIIAGTIKHFTLTVKGLKSFKDAQVTRGGLRTEEFDPETLESKKLRRLFACGEVLDVDGECGGYNLFWAFASGITAGRNAAQTGSPKVSG